MICRTLGLFVNTLTADHKYSFLNSDSLTQPIGMHLSKKQKKFCQIFSAFLKSKSNFQHFEINDDPHSLYISHIMDCERLGHSNDLKVAFQKTLRPATW